MTAVFVKDPEAVLDYAWDWSLWLADGETISACTVTVQTGLTKNSDTASTTAVIAWLSGGTALASYTAACRITTTAGRTDERTMTITVRDR